MHTINPLDGRYYNQTKSLRRFFSEASFLTYLFFVEVEYFIALSEQKEITELPELSKTQKNNFRSLYKNFTIEDIKKIKETEKITKHDLKAIEYFFKEKLNKTELKNYLEFIHFGLTSDDTKNIAYGLMIKNGLNKVILPILDNLQDNLKNKSDKYLSFPLLALTHGQPATPTTVGKEFFIFYKRLEKQINSLKQIKIIGKLNGATGNYSAHHIAYPKIDWPKFSYNFIKKIGLEPNLHTTQVESHDNLAEIFDNIARINNILKNLSQDMWLYISRGIFIQKISEGQIGSSTMPHKINPIDFENAEGNFGLANSLLHFMSDKLPISRLQRDLSDSAVMRNIGVAFGYSLVAYNSLLSGLNKIELDKKKTKLELNEHPEVLAEAIQTILRKHSISEAYEKLKSLSQGKSPTLDDFKNFIKDLKIPENDKKKLLELKPEKYTGLANKIVEL